MYIVYQYIINTCVKIIYGLRVARTHICEFSFLFFFYFFSPFPQLISFQHLVKTPKSKMLRKCKKRVIKFKNHVIIFW